MGTSIQTDKQMQLAYNYGR